MMNFLATVILSATSCDTCPPAASVKLGDGTVTSATAGSGMPSRANSVWAFYADTTLGPLSFLGAAIPANPGFLFRAQYGTQGELVRIFNNQVLAPTTLGDQLFFDAVLRPTLKPSLNYSGESYASENGSSIGTTECGTIFAGPFSVLQAMVEFSGTTNSLLDRVDGHFRFTSTLNPIFANQAPPNFKSETVAIDGFATKETDLLGGG